MKYILICTLVFLVGCDISEENSSQQLDVFVDNLDTPWGIDFLPDGRMLLTERNGRVSISDGDERSTIKDIDVREVAESGLLGIAADPDFEKNRHIYVYYTHTAGHNRVSRYRLLEQGLAQETVLVDNIPSAQFHDGGRIAFGPDNRLYITTGDATNPSSAQDTQSLAGKILRINKDGTVPADNPFGNLVYSYGHRNPQGLAWINGTLFSCEHGPSRHDEINIIQKGANYGWPNVCGEQDEGTVEPIRCYTEFTLAPGDIASDSQSLYVSGLRGRQLRKLSLDGHKVLSESIVIDSLGRLRSVTVHEGILYVSTSNRDGRGIPKPGDDKIILLR